MKHLEELFNRKFREKTGHIIESMNNALNEYREKKYDEYSFAPAKIVNNLIDTFLNANTELIKIEISLRKEIFFQGTVDSTKKKHINRDSG